MSSPYISSKEKFFYNPVSFDPSFLPKKWQEHGRYFIHLLYRERIYKRYGGGWIPLSSVLLKLVMPKRHYRTIINMIKKHGYILENPSYLDGRECKKFRLTPRYHDAPHIRYQVTDKVLIRKLIKLEQNKHTAIVHPVHRHLHKFLLHIQVKDNFPNELPLQVIHDKGFWFHHDPYGRIHTNLTNLDKDHRKYISFMGKQLACLDIVNSQPLFLLILLYHYLSNNNHFTPFNTFTLFGEPRERGGGGIPLCGNNFPSLERYKSLVESGSLYEYLMERTGLSREEVKDKLWSNVFFCNNHVYGRFTRIFEEEFPEIMKAIREMKTKDYRFLSHQLQRTESNFVMNRIVARYKAISPDCFIGTIHDCLIVEQEEVEVLRQVIMDAFQEVSLSPQLKEERWE